MQLVRSANDDENMARALIFYETRNLHQWVCDSSVTPGDLRTLSARITEACAAYELGQYRAAVAALKGDVPEDEHAGETRDELLAWLAQRDDAPPMWALTRMKDKRLRRIARQLR